MSERTTKVLTIGPFPNHRAGRIRFMGALLKAGIEGYELPDTKFNTDSGMQWGGQLRIKLHKYKAAIVTPEDRLVDLEQRILDKEKLGKEDLLWFADQMGLIIPSNVKVPVAIAKFLRDSLDSQQDAEGTAVDTEEASTDEAADSTDETFEEPSADEGQEEEETNPIEG